MIDKIPNDEESLETLNESNFEGPFDIKRF